MICGIFSNAGQNGDGITVTIGNKVKYIPSNLFYTSKAANTPKITAVIFEENSSCESIWGNAFSGCATLTSITLPDSITTIGEYVFSGCTSLSTIRFNGTVDKWNAVNKYNNWSYNVPATEVICSNGSVSLS